MRKRRASLVLRSCTLAVSAASLAVFAAASSAQSPQRGADALLAIDQNRASVVEHVVGTWGASLATSSRPVSIDELRAHLLSLRADRLLAASLAGSADGVRAIAGLTTMAAKPMALSTKALGDVAADVVYTPVTPCRLVDTRGTFAAVYQGDGMASHNPKPFVPNEIRTYTIQGGNGVCLTQLPNGLAPSAVQLQVFGMPTTSASGDIEILPQGASFGSTATMVYVGTIAFNTVSTAAKVNTSNHEISVQVRGGGANVAIDVVGYFAAPSGNGGKYFVQGGNAFGTAASLGTADNQPLDLIANGQSVMMYLPNATSPNVVGGHPANSINAALYGQTVAGGGSADTGCYDPNTQTRSCGNQAAGIFATVSGGIGNFATGISATVGGGTSNTVGTNYATVAGGLTNTASGNHSAIAGGESNLASGLASAIAGGDNNVASGSYAAVPGGIGNTASGFRSFAAGSNVLADQSQCAVFGFFTLNGVANCKGVGNIIRLMANHGFSVDWGAANGNGGGTWWVEINDITPCRPINTYTNAYLSCSGVWTSNSDRNKKENFRAIDPLAVLAKVVALPVTQWNYKVEPGVLRMGPMAQDFHTAFDLGPDNLTIAQTDEAGVAFGAIQGLHELMRRKDDVIARQQHRLDDQQQRIDDQQRQLDDQRRRFREQQRRLEDLEARFSRIEAASATTRAVNTALTQATP